MTTIVEPTPSSKDYKIVGTRPIRHDGVDKVTGRARYGADVNLPGMLYGKILRSPYAHARIKSIDTSKALSLPDVKAVVTSEDFPEASADVMEVAEGAMLNPKFLSNNVMAAEKVLYVGHAVAAVVANTMAAAEEALKMIHVEYEPLPFVLDGIEAMKPEAPLLHDRLYRSEGEYFRAGGLLDTGKREKASNIASHFVLQTGDPESGFEHADYIVEREFNTSQVHQGYIEPHSATASWNQDGTISIWDSSQAHFSMRDMTAQVLQIPVSQITVTPMEIGGGFGGKLIVYLEPVAAMLSKKTGHPVKITMSRKEVFEGTGPTAAAHIRAKIGATKHGKIVAAEGELIYEAGAFPGSPVNLGTLYIFGPYDIPNARVEGYDVLVNKPKTAAYRAPGGPAAAFAGETLIDELAQKLEIDPLEFRSLNAAKEGTRRVNGLTFRKVGFLEVLESARNHPHYKSKIPGANSGRGIAAAVSFNMSGESCAVGNVNSDGTVSLLEGSPDIGGTRTTVAMQMAEALGIPAEDIHPSIGDTNTIGFTAYTAGSSVTYKTGWACFEAAQDIKRQMIERAAVLWEVPKSEIDFQKGVLIHVSDPELQISFKELSAVLNQTGGPIVGRANINLGGESPGFTVHMVDVEVDPETGKTKILRYTAIQDVGTAIHPGYVEGQMQGAASQGIGWALNEEYFLDDQGQMQNSSLLDYRLPTSLDLPMIDTVVVEIKDPTHPFGVRGVGEVSIIPPVPALANAIHNAVDIRMNNLPMSPGAVLDALWRKPTDPND